MNVSDLSNITAEEWNVIYDDWGGWNGQGSGGGSFIENNYYLIDWLQTFIQKNNIKNIVDAGCGDLQWMSAIFKNKPSLMYTGIDCVDSLIKAHRKNYSYYAFFNKNISQEVPLLKGKYDLVICKDVLQHNTKRPELIINSVNKIKAKVKLLISPEYITCPKLFNYTWILNYQSDEQKSIYINEQAT